MARVVMVSPRAELLLPSMRPEGMRMFQAAEALAADIEQLRPHALAARPNTAKHLENSMDSVLFNMAEGIGSFKPKIKIGAYEIARKEANEVRAALRKLVIAKVCTQPEIQKAYNLAGSVVGMLTAAIKTLENKLDD